MAEGWVLVGGIAVLLGAIGLAAAVLRARREAPEAQDSLMAVGPGIVALGIIFGEDPLIGYGLIAAGVIVSIAAAMLRRSASGR